MRSFWPCLVVMLAGLAIAAGAAVALATAPSSRGGQAQTTKAPPLPKQERGIVRLPKQTGRFMPTLTNAAPLSQGGRVQP